MNDTNPISALLKSKGFWTMLLTALVSFLVSLVPQFDAVRNELLTVFLVIGSVLVGGYAVEDAAVAHGQAQAQAYIAQSQLVSAQMASMDTPSYKTDRQ